jgi:hypothetical protein
LRKQTKGKKKKKKNESTCTKTNKAIANERGKNDRVQGIDTRGVDGMRFDNDDVTFHKQMKKCVHGTFEISGGHDGTNALLGRVFASRHLLARLTPTARNKNVNLKKENRRNTTITFQRHWDW